MNAPASQQIFPQGRPKKKSAPSGGSRLLGSDTHFATAQAPSRMGEPMARRIGALTPKTGVGALL